MTQAGTLPGPPILGYRDLRLLARGSSAEVYQAVQERLGRPVAIKILQLDDVTTADQVRNELDVAVRLSQQPHIVSIIDTGTTGGRPYLVMEFCEDGSYAQILDDHGPRPVEEVIDLGIKVAEALQAAHDAGIIHRDIKPANILRSRFGPALTDFGIARKPGELSGTITVNKLTPHHASPEALQRGKQSASSDVYSLGSTLWNLLTGYPPFANAGDKSPDPFEYRERVLANAAPLVPRGDVPPWLQQELARSMTKHPESRHPSAAAFADALRRGWLNWTGQPWASPSAYPPISGSAGGAGGSGAVGTAAAPRVAPPATDPATHPPVNRPVPANDATPQPVLFPPVGPVSGPPMALSPMTGHPMAGPPMSAPPVAPPGHTGWPEPADESDEEPPRRIGLGTFVVTALVGALLGVIALVVFNQADDDPPPQAGNPVTGAPAPGDSASVNPQAAPGNVRLEDRGDSVTIRWRDHSGGRAAYYVVGGPATATPAVMTEAQKGVTSVDITGLNPNVDYCFTVVAIMSVDEVAPSDRVCTHRRE